MKKPTTSITHRVTDDILEILERYSETYGSKTQALQELLRLADRIKSNTDVLQPEVPQGNTDVLRDVLQDLGLQVAQMQQEVSGIQEILTFHSQQLSQLSKPDIPEAAIAPNDLPVIQLAIQDAIQPEILDCNTTSHTEEIQETVTLTLAELAARLAIGSGQEPKALAGSLGSIGVIRNDKTQTNLTKIKSWTSGKDPEGIAWLPVDSRRTHWVSQPLDIPEAT
jgi:hypothetical protein